MAKGQMNIGAAIVALKKAQANIGAAIVKAKKLQANIGGVIVTLWQSQLTVSTWAWTVTAADMCQGTVINKVSKTLFRGRSQGLISINKATGAIIAYFNHGASNLRCDYSTIFEDSSGNMYVGRLSGRVGKFNKDGTFVGASVDYQGSYYYWNFTQHAANKAGESIVAMILQQYDYSVRCVYLVKYNASLVEQWRLKISDDDQGVSSGSVASCAASPDNLYFVMPEAGQDTKKRRMSDGGVVWTCTGKKAQNSVFLSNGDLVYSNGSTVGKINASGTFVKSITMPGASPVAQPVMTVDAYDNIYVSVKFMYDYGLIKLDSDLNVIYSITQLHNDQGNSWQGEIDPDTEDLYIAAMGYMHKYAQSN